MSDNQVRAGSLAADTTDRDPETLPQAAHRLVVPGLIGREVGLGEVVKRATRAVGIRPCAPCQRRAEVLDRWLVLTPDKGL